jgi:hypothetical protein
MGMMTSSFLSLLWSTYKSPSRLLLKPLSEDFDLTPTCCQIFPHAPQCHRVHATASTTSRSTLVPPRLPPPSLVPRCAWEPHHPPNHHRRTGVQRSIHHQHRRLKSSSLLLFLYCMLPIPPPPHACSSFVLASTLHHLQCHRVNADTFLTTSTLSDPSLFPSP